MAERRKIGFVPQRKPLKVEEYGLVIASDDPKEFIRQLEEARQEAVGSGSERAELDASFLEDLADDLKDGLRVPASLITQKITTAVYQPGDQNKVIFPGER